MDSQALAADARLDGGTTPITRKLASCPPPGDESSFPE